MAEEKDKTGTETVSRKTIALLSILAITLVLALVFHFQPDIRETAVGLIALGFLLIKKKVVTSALIAVKKLFFKKSVMSFATVAWKRVAITGSMALSKRAFINSTVGFFKDRIVKPFITPVRLYAKHLLAVFKAAPVWKKTWISIVGFIPASVMVWLAGVGKLVSFILGKISLAKFLTFLLHLISMSWLFLKGAWSTWIKPYIDIIIITIFIGYAERIPVIGRMLRRARIVTKWKLRSFRHKKKQIVDKHVDQRIAKLSEKLQQHVEEKGSKTAAPIAKLNEKLQQHVEENDLQTSSAETKTPNEGSSQKEQES